MVWELLCHLKKSKENVCLRWVGSRSGFSFSWKSKHCWVGCCPTLKWSYGVQDFWKGDGCVFPVCPCAFWCGFDSYNLKWRLILVIGYSQVVGVISFNIIGCVCVCVHTQSCPTLCDPMGYSPARLLCLWNFLGKNTGAGCHFLLQEIFPTQGLNLCLLWLLHWKVGSLPAEPPGKPNIIGYICSKM